jgi:hypothetical protein
VPSDRASDLLRHLRSLAVRPGTAGVPDGRLLADFVQRRDEAAFTELVRRHGPMVLAVCRSILANAHVAEDAFQATFLLLARKAATIRKPMGRSPNPAGPALTRRAANRPAFRAFLQDGQHSSARRGTIK